VLITSAYKLGEWGMNHWKSLEKL